MSQEGPAGSRGADRGEGARQKLGAGLEAQTQPSAEVRAPAVRIWGATCQTHAWGPPSRWTQLWSHALSSNIRQVGGTPRRHGVPRGRRWGDPELRFRHDGTPFSSQPGVRLRANAPRAPASAPGGAGAPGVRRGPHALSRGREQTEAPAEPSPPSRSAVLCCHRHRPPRCPHFPFLPGQIGTSQQPPTSASASAVSGQWVPSLRDPPLWEVSPPGAASGSVLLPSKVAPPRVLLALQRKTVGSSVTRVPPGLCRSFWVPWSFAHRLDSAPCWSGDLHGPLQFPPPSGFRVNARWGGFPPP